MSQKLNGSGNSLSPKVADVSVNMVTTNKKQSDLEEFFSNAVSDEFEHGDNPMKIL